MTDIYHYHPITGRYLGTDTAQLDPLDQQPLVPAHATTVQPPAAAEHQAAVHSGGDWTLQADFTGTEYWLADGSHHQITELNVEPPAEALSAEPLPPLDDLKTAAISSLSAGCEAAITAGFESDALGTVHTYPSTRDDQTNLLGLKVEGADNPLVCFDGTEWDNRLHTYAQIEQVFSNGVARKLDLIQNQFHSKRAAVDAATNQAEIDAVDPAYT